MTGGAPEFRALVEREGFPDTVEVSTSGGPEGQILRATAEGGVRGFEILLTEGAVRMYGGGPAVATILKRLLERAHAGLPPARAPGEYEREVFVGD